MANKRLFKLEDIVELTKNIKTANNILKVYIDNNYIRRIRKDYYIYVDLSSKLIAASKFEIASNIISEAYISHHSAFEYYGLANQVFYEVMVSSPKRFRNFEFENIAYNCNVSKIKLGIDNAERDKLVKVTSIERTIIDSIYNFDKAGGFEEVMECIALIRNVDEKKLMKILDEYSIIALYQRVGFIIECYKDKFKISDSFIKKCKSKITNKKQYMLVGKKGQIFIKDWNLCVPKSLVKLRNKEKNIIV